MTSRNLCDVIPVITHFSPVELWPDCFSIWKNNLYTAPEIKTIGWERLRGLINRYLEDKYGTFREAEFENYDFLVIQLLQGIVDYRRYLPTNSKFRPCSTKYDDFVAAIRHQIQVPILHG